MFAANRALLGAASRAKGVSIIAETTYNQESAVFIQPNGGTYDFVIPFPAGSAAGEEWIGIFTIHGDDHTWQYFSCSVLSSGVESDCSFAAVRRTAGSSSGVNTTLRITNTSPYTRKFQVIGSIYRLSEPLNGVEATASTGSSDPSPITASWGAANNLVIAAVGARDVDDSYVGGPSGFDGFVSLERDFAQFAKAHKFVTTATEDPGSFTAAPGLVWPAQTITIVAG